MPARAFFIHKGAQFQRHAGGVYFHRAHGGALAAAGTVLHQLPQLGKQVFVRLALVHLRIVDRLKQRAEAEVLVTRVVEERFFREEHGADLLALAATGAHLNVGEQADEPVLVCKARGLNVLDEPVEGEGERLDRRFALGELGRIHDGMRVHAALEGLEGLHLLFGQELDLGDADAVLARYLAVHFLRLGHDGVCHFFGIMQHDGVVGVYGDVHVAVAVARVHVVGDDDAGGEHVLVYLLEGALERGVVLRKLVEVGGGPVQHFLIGKLCRGNLALRYLGDVGEFAVQGFVFHGHAGNAAHILQCGAVGLAHAFLIELFDEVGKVGDDVYGDDDIFVDLEAGRAAGDGRELVPVFPVVFRLCRVFGDESVYHVVGRTDIHDVAHAFFQRGFIVGVHLQDEHGDGFALVLRGLFLVFDGFYILDAELFQRGYLYQIALCADGVAQGHNLLDDQHGVVHGTPEEFQHHHAEMLLRRMADETGFHDDAVCAFLLHAGQPAEELVGDVLAQAGLADLVSLQGDDGAHAAGDVLDLEYGGFIFHDLVAGVVHPLHIHDFAGGSDHAVGEDVVQRGAVFKGKGTAGVFRYVAAYGGRRLGRGVYGEEHALVRRRLDGGCGDDARLYGEGHFACVHFSDAAELLQRHHHRALAGGNGAARTAGRAAAGDEGELHLVGEAHHGADFFCAGGGDHKQRQLHAQVCGIGGAFHQRAGAQVYAVARDHLPDALDELITEFHVGIVGAPEHGEPFAQGGGVMVGEAGHGLIEAGLHALAYGFRIYERVVPDKEQLFCKRDGRFADCLWPVLELVQIDTQHPVHEKL